jgi:hypothetical protein
MSAPITDSTNRRIDLGIATALAVFTWVIFGFFANLTVDPHHDGIMLKPAMDVREGQILFRDTFSQYGPLTTYLQAASLGVSPTLLSLRWLTVAAYAGSLFFLYLAWRAVLPRVLSLMACLMFIISAPFYHSGWPMLPWSSVLALFFQSLALLAMMRVIAGVGSLAKWAWVLGVACACTLWCRQPVGIIMTASVGVIAAALQLTGWRPQNGTAVRTWGRAAAGFGVVSILILGHLAINGALGAWWVQNILWPRRWAAAADGGMFSYFSVQNLVPAQGLMLLAILAAGFAPSLMRRFRPTLARWVDLAWMVALAVAYVTFARGFTRDAMLIPTGGWNGLIAVVLIVQSVWVILPPKWRNCAIKSPDYYLVAALAGISLGAAVQLYPVPCPQHTFWALAPGVGVLVYACWKWPRMEVWSCVLLLGLVLLPASYDKYRWGHYTLGLPWVKMESPAVLKGMKVPPDFASEVQRVDAVLRPLLDENPNRSVLLYGSDALYLEWFKNRENPSPYYVDWAALLTKDDWYLRLAYLIKTKPVVFVHKKDKENILKFFKVVGYRIVHEEPSLELAIALPVEGAVEPPLAELLQINVDSR